MLVGTQSTSPSKLSMQLNVSWENLFYSVGSREILKGLSGQAPAGRALAIMGSSGAGKTTLLNALSDRLGTDSQRVLHGEIRLNDVLYHHRHRQLIGFVPQDDIIGHMATPTSALRFALRVRRGLDMDATHDRVEATLEALKLTACRNTIVGIPGVVQGLSGGERKRTSIGIEMIADTPVLMLDEPTSGLDSSTASTLCATLQAIAREGRTVLYTIHQPTAEVCGYFDDLLLLTQGHVAFHGPMDRAVQYFEAIGFPCPDAFTPTDHFMVLLQDPAIAPLLLDQWAQYLAANDVAPSRVVAKKPRRRFFRQPKEKAALDGTAASYAYVSPTATATGRSSEEVSPQDMTAIELASPSPMNEIDPAVKGALGDAIPACLTPVPLGVGELSATHAGIEAHIASEGSSVVIQLVELLRRACSDVYTDKMFVAMTIIQHIVFALISGIIFVNIKDDITGVQDRLGLLFLVVLNKGFGHAMLAFNRFKTVRHVFIREQQSGSYSPAVFFATLVAAEIPLMAFAVLLECIIVYFMADLHASASSFFYFFAVLLAMSQCGFAVGALIGSVFENQIIGTKMVPMTLIPMMLVQGLMADNNQVRPYWYWLEKIAFLRYGFLLVLRNEFDNLGPVSCDVTKLGADLCALQPRTGPQVVAALGFDDEQDAPWAMWVSLGCMLVGLRGLQLLAMYVISRSKF